MANKKVNGFRLSVKIVVAFAIVSFVLLTIRQYVMVSSMSPFIKEVYDSIGTLPRKGVWTEDATFIAEKYFHLGMSPDEARNIIESSDMEFGKEGHTDAARKKKFEETISAGKLIPGGYGGVYQLLLGYHNIVVVLDFNDDQLQEILTVVNRRGL